MIKWIFPLSRNADRFDTFLQFSTTKKRAPEAPEDLEEEATKGEVSLLQTQNQTSFNMVANDQEGADEMPRTWSTATVAKNKGIKITPNANDNFVVSVAIARRPVDNDIDLSSLVLNPEPHRDSVINTKQPTCHNSDTIHYQYLNQIVNYHNQRLNRAEYRSVPSSQGDEV